VDACPVSFHFSLYLKRAKTGAEREIKDQDGNVAADMTEKPELKELLRP
jgi:hypothetical protein